MFSSIKGILSPVIVLFFTLIFSKSAVASSLSDTVKKITPSVVAIGLYSPLDSDNPEVLGTGFAINDGLSVVTNFHVVEKILDPSKVQYYVAISGTGQTVRVIKAEIDKIDPKHDLAILSIKEKLPALKVAGGDYLSPGEEIAFTGFPIGPVLGLYAATHRGLIAAVTPDAIPAMNSQQLSINMLDRLKHPDFIYQLDATAYPGNSGSPIYLPESGEVIGVISKVLVRDTKESAISSPTGISYGVPAFHLNQLINKDK